MLLEKERVEFTVKGGDLWVFGIHFCDDPYEFRDVAFQLASCECLFLSFADEYVFQFVFEVVPLLDQCIGSHKEISVDGVVDRWWDGVE